MIVQYNSLNRMEKPQLILCNPGSVYSANRLLDGVVGILADHEAEELVFNFNATSELNFRLNKVQRSDPAENAYTANLFRAAQNRRLIFVAESGAGADYEVGQAAEDAIGYFMITNVEDGFENGVQYKDIKAQSIDIELQQKMIPYIEDGTYEFTTLLETIVQSLPLWSIGSIDPNVASKYRTFSDVDTSLNCLTFLMDNMQDAYECIIVFDIVFRTINVYDQNNYVVQTNVHITKEDFINSLNITEDAEDIYTAISVLGDDNIVISPINPLGTNTIYNFDYYLDWMSPDLKTAMITWKTAVANAEDNYKALNLAYYQALDVASGYIADINQLTTLVNMYERCKNNMGIDKDSANSEAAIRAVDAAAESAGVEGWDIDTTQEIANIISAIDTKISTYNGQIDTIEGELEEENATIESYREDINEIISDLSLTEYLTDAQYGELSNYIFQGDYKDEYVIITDSMSYQEQFEQMQTLYDRAMLQLERVSKPTQEFNIDVENFIFSKDFETWSDQLETGCLINVELDEDDVAALFLSNITINFDDHKLTMTFGNRFNKFDSKSLFDDMLGNINRSANTIDYIKEILYPVKNGQINRMQETLSNSRRLTASNALASTNQEVVIDESGYLGRKADAINGGYDPQQVKITNNSIVFTNNDWVDTQTAIGEINMPDGAVAYGVNAAAIFGDIIVGTQLHITDGNGNDVLRVMEDSFTTQISDLENGRISALENSANGLSVTVGELSRDLTDISDNLDNLSATSVTTGMGYSFTDEGLLINSVGEGKISNRLDNTGMYVTDSDDNAVLTANNNGVVAVNLTANNYLTIGLYSRFQDYSTASDTMRTGCFFVVPDTD